MMAAPLHRGIMRYRCTSCDKEFDVPEGDRARCPKCLRIHDVEPVESPSSAISRYRGPLILFAFVALGVGAYVAWYLSQGEDADADEERPVEIGPLSVDELREHLDDRHFKRGEVLIPFEEDETVTAFARKAAHGRASQQEKASALMEAVRGMLDENHALYISISPRVAALKSPAETLAALQSDETFSPYSYELAALLVTACRAVGVPAVLSEIYTFESTNRPADASGTQGYFAAALPRGEGRNYRRPLLYDPASGRSEESAAGEADVLTDVEAVAAALSISALHRSSHLGDTSGGERLATLAVRLRPSSATAHAARGTARLLGGGGQLSGQAALEEYQTALRLRADPQRKILVARILLALGQAPQAEELVRSALSDASEFGAAHGLMALIHVARESFEEAQAALTRAEQLEPRDPHISLLWAQYYIAQRDYAAAAEAARAVVDRIPDDPQPRLLLAQVLYQDANYDAATEQFRELVRRNPDNEQIREILREMFEYDPDEDQGAEDEGEDEVVAEADVDGGVAEGDAGLGLGFESPDSLQLQMGEGLGGNLRLGGEGGFQLRPIGGGGLMQ